MLKAEVLVKKHIFTMSTNRQSDHALPHWKCVFQCYADCPCINLPDQEIDKNIKKQHPKLGFKFITSLHVVLLMLEFHWKTNKNLH